ncbi:MAG: hypothetical protein U0441_35665 [Polyangiaceae bacterium]
MNVLLRPGQPRPGETFEAEAHLISENETPLDRVTFELIGDEVVTVQHGKSASVWKEPLVRLRAEVPGRPLTRGEHVYRARFQLPPRLPPTYRGRVARIEYTLEVRCDIPWWPDRFERYDVPIPNVAAPTERRPGVFVTRQGGAFAGELYAEMSLASTTFAAGEIVNGTVALQSARRETDVRVSLVAHERVFPNASFWQGGSYRATFEALRWSYALTKGAPEDGQPYPFRFQLAADMMPTFAGTMSALDWSIELVSEGLFTRKVLLRAPIAILPSASATGTATPTRVPAVGDQRRFESLHRVGGRLGLAFDPDHGELRGTFGGVALRVASESRPDGARVTVARLSWPSLGMGLHVEHASWTDAISLREIEVGHKEFDDSFHVRARDAAQARALFDASLCALLMTCDDVRVDDDGAELSVPLTLVDEQALLTFATGAMQSARLFGAAFQRIPPPPAFEGRALAWMTFAERMGGRFEPGSVSVRDALLGQERLEIETEWSDDGTFRATSIRVHLSTPIDPTALSPAAESQRKALETAANARCEITTDRIAVLLPRPIPDPSDLDPHLDDLTRLVQSVKGRGGAGPFRS